MEVVLALLAAAAQLIPEVEAAMPTVQALLQGNTVTAAQMVQLWTAVAAIESQVAAQAATVEAQAPAA